MTMTLTHERLAEAFRSMWPDAKRSETLGRIIVHERQFENWWKFEVATHLWELAEELGVLVWIEADARADVLLAPAKDDTPARVDLSGSPRIPIELKTVGTFWKNEEKAYTEHGKKRLVHDMKAAIGRGKAASPFAVVALLVTHVGTPGDPAMLPFLELPRALATSNKLTPCLDEAVPLPLQPKGFQVCAHQFVWTT